VEECDGESLSTMHKGGSLTPKREWRTMVIGEPVSAHADVTWDRALGNIGKAKNETYRGRRSLFMYTQM
jgi:hypothetical protein